MKPLILGVAGVLVGVGVAFAIFVFVLGGGQKPAEAKAEPTPVAFGGKLGPHITLQDRVFNLQGSGPTPVYLKVQTIIEFETAEPAWAKFAKTCVAVLPSRAPSEAMVSIRPLVSSTVSAPNEGGAVSPCVAEETKLLDEFSTHIGTGRQLIEDAVTTIVGRHTVAEISKTEGKEALKKEIKEAVEHLIPEPKVTRILFTNFITQ